PISFHRKWLSEGIAPSIEHGPGATKRTFRTSWPTERITGFVGVPAAKSWQHCVAANLTAKRIRSKNSENRSTGPMTVTRVSQSRRSRENREEGHVAISNEWRARGGRVCDAGSVFADVDGADGSRPECRAQSIQGGGRLGEARGGKALGPGHRRRHRP